MQDKHIIKCPHCETEYFLGEIFLPKYFLGQPKNVERDFSGRIIWNDGLEQNLEEKFICEKCNSCFKVNCSVECEVVLDERLDIDKDYSSQKYSKRIFLKEN